MKPITVNNLNIYPFASSSEMINYIDGHKGILVAINAEKILHADKMLKNIINQNVGYCDGVGAVLAVKRKGVKRVCKIAGCDLWLQIIETFHTSKSFYLIGGRQNVIDETIEKLNNDFHGINIVEYRNGFFNDNAETQFVIDDVALKKPDVVMVAMGSPKQEILMERMREVHPNAIYLGLGGSFDVYTGHVNRAPKWWIDHNLEFAYRLFKQPSRITRQIHLLKFVWWIVVGKI